MCIRDRVAHEVKLPPGYFLKWTGQYELLERVRARMAWLLPLTIAIVFLILFVNFKGAAQALIVMTGVPFSAVGAIWTLWIAHFNTSIAVWVGMIALLGVAAETASVMVVYLDDEWSEGRQKGTPVSYTHLRWGARTPRHGTRVSCGPYAGSGWLLTADVGTSPGDGAAPLDRPGR